MSAESPAIERELSEQDAEQVQENEQEVAPEEDLSDLDEDQFKDAPLDDEDVNQLSSHRRKPAASMSSEGTDTPEKDVQDHPNRPTELKRRKRAPKRDDSEPASQRQQPSEAPAEPEDVDPRVRERRELEARIDAALKPSGTKRRKRLAGDDLEQMQDEVIAELRDRMRAAALEDVEAIRQGQPALAKIRMLPEVTSVLRKNALTDSILDGNLLESVRIWLEPLPDASLPSFEIQKELFRALVELPIKTIHLRESGLGKVVVFYQKSKRPHLTIKRAAEKLIGDWTRPIMGRSDNYRDRQVRTAAYDPNMLASSSGVARSDITEKRSAAEESALRRGRAAMPSTNGVTYQVAPMNMGASSNAAVAGHRPQATDSQLRRMKTKLMQSKSRSRKSQVSVEGRDLN